MKILFSIVSVVDVRVTEITALVVSAKKHFLTRHDVDYVVFTDVEWKPHIPGVRYVDIDNSHCAHLKYTNSKKY